MKSNLLPSLSLVICLSALLMTGCLHLENTDHDWDKDGVTEDDGDCDDDNVAIVPGATEIACDGIDQNCDPADDGPDLDEDGWFDCPGDASDCDDNDAANFPGNPEICDQRDNDCDDLVDEELTGFTWWIDGDSDGFGAGELTPTCSDEPPSDQHVSADGTADEDCDDTESTVYPGAEELCDGVDNDCDGVADPSGSFEYWPDGDSDGVGDQNGAITSCFGDLPDGFVLPTPGTSDCNDDEPESFPGNTEICDVLDNDCNGETDEGFDADLDGFTICGADGDVLALADNDCDDTESTVFPGNPELCDGLDNDCDGFVDNNMPDADNDGVTACDDCDDTNPASYPGANEICDGLLNDCTSTLPADESDDDGDLYIECTVPSGVTLPAGLLGGDDCDDATGFRFPGNPEVCDGLDNDCNGVIPPLQIDVDGDGFLACGSFLDRGLGLSGGDDCDDTLATGAAVYPGATEVCDGDLEDCDGTIDAPFDLDGDGFFDDTDPGCVATYGPQSLLDCDDSEASINPNGLELCDLVDNDCDTLIDTADPSFEGSDYDEDGDPAIACGGQDCDDNDVTVNGDDLDADGESTCDGDCDDSSPLFNTSQVETCDSEDNDCDGLVDNGVLGDADGDGFTVSGCGFTGDDCLDSDAHVFPDQTYTSGWQRQCLPAASPGFFGSWAHARVNLPSFFTDPQTGTQYLYFRGHHNQTFHQVGYVSRLAGATLWSGIQGPIFSENPVGGSWDGRKLSHPSVAYVPGKVQGYVMAYHAQDDASTDRAVGIATANLAMGQDTDADGVADGPFQRTDLAGNAIGTEAISVSASVTAGDNERVLNPSLWYDATNQLLHMWYTGRYGDPNDFVILHASCDVVTTDCAPADWIKTDTNGDGDPDIYLSGTTGSWDDLNTQQTFVMEHSNPTGFFGYELEVWYTGGSASIGYVQGDIMDSTSWSKYPSPVLTATTATGRFDSESVTGRGVYWDGTSYNMYYGTSVLLPSDINGQGTDPRWGVGNYSGGASYIGHAINTPPSFDPNLLAITCTSADGEVADNGPDTVELEVYDGSTMIVGPVFGNAPGGTGFGIQSSAFTIPITLTAGAHDITVLGTDAGGAQRSATVSLTCP
jgi:hypothetical protein